MNFISLSNDDIIIYNNIQTKVYKNFINHHKIYGNSFNINNNENDDMKLYIISQNYCKNFKYNICLCYRKFNNLKNIEINYNDYYKCINNKKILYNPHNFNFIKPISVIVANETIFPLNITTYYRQEYIPYIVHNEFLKYKKIKKIINIMNKKILEKYFNLFIENNKLNETIYHNELNNVFSNQSNTINVDNNNILFTLLFNNIYKM